MINSVRESGRIRSFLFAEPSDPNQQEKGTKAYSDNDLTCVLSFLQRLPYLVRA